MGDKFRRSTTPNIDPKDVDEALDKTETTEEELPFDGGKDFENDTNSAVTVAPEKAMAEMYGSFVNAGTEEVNQDDLKTPTLKIIQKLTEGIENPRIGWFYRSDTKEQLETVDVNLTYVTTQESMNFNQTELEKVKVYYGFYAGTNEPFKLYLRGWNIAAHREFQTEVVMYKKRFKIPMFALTVRLSTKEISGTIKATGKAYSTHQIQFEALKDPKDQTGLRPLVELNPERIGVLYQAVTKFKEAAVVAEETKTDEHDDLPFS